MSLLSRLNNYRSEIKLDPKYRGWFFAFPIMSIILSSVMRTYELNNIGRGIWAMLATVIPMAAIYEVQKIIFPFFPKSSGDYDRNINESIETISQRYSKGFYDGMMWGMAIGMLQAILHDAPRIKMPSSDAANYTVSLIVLISTAALMLIGWPDKLKLPASNQPSSDESLQRALTILFLAPRTEAPVGRLEQKDSAFEFKHSAAAPAA